MGDSMSDATYVRLTYTRTVGQRWIVADMMGRRYLVPISVVSASNSAFYAPRSYLVRVED